MEEGPPLSKKIKLEVEDDFGVDRHPKPLQLNLNSQGRCFSCLKDSKSVTISTAFQPISGILTHLELEDEVKKGVNGFLASGASRSVIGRINEAVLAELNVKLCHKCSEHYGVLFDLFRKADKIKKKIDVNDEKLENVEILKKLDKTEQKIKAKLVLIRKGIEAGDKNELGSLNCLIGNMAPELKPEATRHIALIHKLRAGINGKRKLISLPNRN